MKKFSKIIISCLLIMAMLLSVLSIGAFATATENEIRSTEIAHESGECDLQYVVISSGFNMADDDSLPALPENTEAYGYFCDTCGEGVATDNKKTPLADGTYGRCWDYPECSGNYRREISVSKEYYYRFDCTECNFMKEYTVLPEGTADAPYGVCPHCKVVASKDMFRISYNYLYYSRPCFFCCNVLQGTKSIYDEENCPFCGESYDIVTPASVDADGKLIYGGGGSKLYYCTQTQKFYEAPVDENENVIDDCPYCDSHQPKKITVLYCATCPSCGTRAERAHLDHFKRPYVMSTLNNIFMSIAVDITGKIDPTNFEITNTCYKCKYSFANDKNIVITRHVNAPDGAVYETSANDRDFHETDYYIENGSEYDNFFERLTWSINRFIRNMKLFFEMLSNG